MYLADAQQQCRLVFIYLVTLWLFVLKCNANTFAVLKNQQKAKCHLNVWMNNLTYTVTNPAYGNPSWDQFEFDYCLYGHDCSPNSNSWYLWDECHRQKQLNTTIWCDFTRVIGKDNGFYFRAIGMNSIDHNLEEIFTPILHKNSGTSCSCSNLKPLLPTDDLKYKLFTDGTVITEINNTLDTIDKSLLRFSVSLYSGDKLLQSDLELVEKPKTFTSSLKLEGLKRCQIYKIRFAFEYGRCKVDANQRVFTDKEFIFDLDHDPKALDNKLCETQVDGSEDEHTGGLVVEHQIYIIVSVSLILFGLFGYLAYYVWQTKRRKDLDSISVVGRRIPDDYHVPHQPVNHEYAYVQNLQRETSFDEPVYQNSLDGPVYLTNLDVPVSQTSLDEPVYQTISEINSPIDVPLDRNVGA
uniref:Uncharacterized protein n=1 Tax=Clytia hemisphaerica TaxID=252671 RepID=A0A7M5V9U3_9CNID|eukprot:TCONS_00025858-protein